MADAADIPRMADAARRTGLAARAALAMVAVVGVALVLTGVVALRLVQGAAQHQALDSLDREADIVADVLGRTPGNLAAPYRFSTRRLFGRQQIRVVGVTPDGQTHGDARAILTPGDVAALQAGQDLRGVRTLHGRSMLFTARPVAGGGAVALVQPASVASGVSADAQRRILAALLAGLAGAVVVGFLLSRRLARPIQQAAVAAHDLAAGRRDVRLRPEGPAEVAEVAAALNALSRALAESEGRQREFLLSVSHELRTPLTAVKGFAEALADGVVPPADVPATGATVLAEASRLDRLVADLLDLARLRAQDFRLDLAPVPLGALVGSAAEVWRARCDREGVPLAVEVPAAEVVAFADATRVRQVLDGLAENALRVTPAGRPLVFAVRREADAAVLEVRDGGPGLTEDDVAVAFERSALYDRYRGSRRVGAGVGLALVAGLVGRMGGRPEAGRAPEGGARFTVRLPLADGTSNGAATGSSAVPDRSIPSTSGTTSRATPFPGEPKP